MSCSSPSPSCQTPANLSFICNGTKASQSCTKSGRFAVGSEQRHSAKAPVYSARLASQAVNVLLELVEDETSTRADKVHGLAALHAKWSYEDVEEPVEGSELLGRQRQRCNAIGPIVFGFTLHKEQIDAIWYLFYEQTDLLLLGETGFGKSLIFQLLPFMTPIAGVFLILMPLELLQVEQSRIINNTTPLTHLSGASEVQPWLAPAGAYV